MFSYIKNDNSRRLVIYQDKASGLKVMITIQLEESQAERVHDFVTFFRSEKAF